MIPRLSRTVVHWDGGVRDAWRIDANGATEWHLRLRSALRWYGHFWLRWLGLR